MDNHKIRSYSIVSNVIKRGRILFYDFSFKKPQRIFVVNKWHKINKWRQVTQITYNYVLDNISAEKWSDSIKISNNVKDYKNPVQLINGFYTEGNLSANQHVRHCYKVIKKCGFDPDTAIIIEAIEAD